MLYDETAFYLASLGPWTVCSDHAGGWYISDGKRSRYIGREKGKYVNPVTGRSINYYDRAIHECAKRNAKFHGLDAYTIDRERHAKIVLEEARAERLSRSRNKIYGLLKECADYLRFNSGCAPEYADLVQSVRDMIAYVEGESFDE